MMIHPCIKDTPALAAQLIDRVVDDSTRNAEVVEGIDERVARYVVVRTDFQKEVLGS